MAEREKVKMRAQTQKKRQRDDGKVRLFQRKR